jgi:hypothetical protein
MGKSLSNYFPERSDFDRFHENLVCLYAYGGHSLGHCRVATQDERHRIGVRVAHGANHRKAIPGVGHMKVGKQQVKALVGNAMERFGYARYGNDLEAVTFQRFPQHIADGAVVLRY